MVHVCFVGYGISSPWNEGKRVISRNIIDALKRETDLDISVVSTVGKNEGRMKGVEYAKSTQLTRYTRGYDILRDAAMIRIINSVDRRKEIEIMHLLNAHFPVFAFYAKRLRKGKGRGKGRGRPIVAHFFGNPHFNHLKRVRVPRAIELYFTTSLETRWFADLGVKNFRAVNPPINTDLFKPLKPTDKLKARRYLNLPEDKFIVLYIGNLGEVRFSASFVEEVKFLKDPNNLLLILANQIDNYWQNSKALCKENVILRREILSEEQKVLVYNAADAFILPFSKETNSYKHVFIIDPPITMLEAMSCGVPVIAPAVFSIPKIIRDGHNGNGYLTSLGDFEKVDAVLHLMSEEVGRGGGINANARKTILNEFSYKKTAARMKQIYEEVLTVND